MNGLDTLKAIRVAAPNVNVVMCTAMGQEIMVIEAMKSGAKDFIVKPFKPDRILEGSYFYHRRTLMEIPIGICHDIDQFNMTSI